MVGGQDEEGASDKRGAVTRLANDPAVASHLKILVIYRVIVHYFFIRTTFKWDCKHAAASPGEPI